MSGPVVADRTDVHSSTKLFHRKRDQPGDSAMKKLAKISSIRQLAKDSKGATMVEYALMLFLILVVAAVAVKTLGSKVTTAVGSASTAFGS
jgi:Flp pilus assembly pilin Flp